ncbi:MAG: phage major capsid protein [Geminicoccaceae bacterium]|nr:phage major capsid protein [Geminicoccaceae bacterium]
MMNGLGEFLQSTIRATLGDADATRELRLGATAVGQSSKVPADGGFLVPSDFRALLLDRIFSAGQLLQRVRRFETDAKELHLPLVDETSRADGSRFGGIVLDWRDEAELLPLSKARFRTAAFIPEKLAAVIPVTAELAEDAVALEELFAGIFSSEAAFRLEDHAINGTGSGRPLGILNSGALITVDKEGSQPAATVNAANLTAMASRLFPNSWPNAIWLANQTTLEQLFKVDTGRLVDFGPDGTTITGRPLIVHESCPALGGVGDLMLVDPSAYAVVERSFTFAVSPFVNFHNDEIHFRVTYRVDGQPLWHTATTPQRGGSTVSPFVALGERA